MKTKEELNELKKNYQELTFKLQELTDEELNYVTGGVGHDNNKAGADDKVYGGMPKAA